jgi:hypothetical protein
MPINRFEFIEIRLYKNPNEHGHQNGRSSLLLLISVFIFLSSTNHLCPPLVYSVALLITVTYHLLLIFTLKCDCLCATVSHVGASYPNNCEQRF